MEVGRLLARGLPWQAIMGCDREGRSTEECDVILEGMDAERARQAEQQARLMKAQDS